MKYQPASFRGVSFFVQAGGMAGGRHVVTHECPDAQHTNEDINTRPRELTVTGYVLGQDFQSRVDSLISACEQSGSGILVHPWLGRLNVKLQSYNVEWSYSDGRMATVTMQFVREPEAPKTPITTDNFSNVITAAKNSHNAAGTAFAKVFTISGRVSHVATAATTVLNKAVTAIQTVKKTAMKIAEYKQLVNKFLAEINLLLLAPTDLATRMTELVTYNFGAGTDANPYISTASFDDLLETLGLTSFGSDLITPAGSAPSVVQESDNQTALKNLVRQIAIITVSRISADLQFTSYDQAIETEQTITGHIETMLESGIDDDLFVQLMVLKSAIVQDIEKRAANLARIQTYTPIRTVPSLVLSYQLYGTVSMESDVVARNGVRHPAFIGGGIPLEVLTDE